MCTAINPNLKGNLEKSNRNEPNFTEFNENNRILGELTEILIILYFYKKNLSKIF
jgi:hypothetical protein